MKWRKDQEELIEKLNLSYKLVKLKIFTLSIFIGKKYSINEPRTTTNFEKIQLVK